MLSMAAVAEGDFIAFLLVSREPPNAGLEATCAARNGRDIGALALVKGVACVE
jgi:hypothetical protein